jgi:hypothetical protein
MNIQQVQEFRLFDRRDAKQLVIERFYRIHWGAFENCFRMEKTTQDGKVITAKPVTEEFAQTVLEYALICLPKEDFEIEKLSTGTDFNYPIPHV